MPIPKEQIPELMQAVKANRVPRWKLDWYKRVATNLQVHTKGQLFTKVDTLFPNEHPESKKHCIETYEPITRGSIWKGINNLGRIFSNSSFTISTGDQVREWLEEYNFEGSNALTHFVDLWKNKAVAEDPNGLFVVYPPDYAEERGMCPLQFVRSEFRYAEGKLADGTEYLAFISEHDSDVTYYEEGDSVKRELFYDETVDRINGRCRVETTYNKRICAKVTRRVLHVVTRDGILVYQDGRKADTVEWEAYQFPEQLSLLPVFPAGGVVSETTENRLFESFVSPFQPFGNLAIIQHRNHRAVDLQFSFPRMAEIQTPCDEPRCAGGKVVVKRDEAHPDGKANCQRCKGTGWITAQSPYKSYARRYDPNDGNNNEHLKVPPVEFYSPDVGIIDYSKDAWKDYLKMAEEAIFIMQKVQTGQVQSKESKQIDLDDLYAWLLEISKTLYNNMRIFLQCLEDYLERRPTTVAVEKPYSFAILTEEDAFLALNAILTSEAPVFVKGNQVENFVNKFVSKSSPVVKALAVLKQYDLLLFYSLEEVQAFKAANTITQEMWTKHVLAYPLLLRLYEQDRTLFDQDIDAITAQLDEEIGAQKVPSASDMRQALIAQFAQQQQQQQGQESANPAAA